MHSSIRHKVISKLGSVKGRSADEAAVAKLGRSFTLGTTIVTVCLMKIDIRPIKISDVESYHRVVDVVAQERRYLPALQAPPIESTLEFVRKNVETGQSQLVAVSDDAVVGWCDILKRTEPIRSHVGVVGMGLLPAYRGRGLGYRLLADTLVDAKRHRFHRIELKVRATNSRAIRLYESTGFRHEGTLSDDVFLDGKFDSTHCMAFFPL